MSLRDYLNDHLDTLVLPQILSQVIDGLDQLHTMGWVHRDLIPDNIVLSLDPLEVRLSDFTYAYPTGQKTKDFRGLTAVYSPDHSQWRDGDLAYDYYALGVIIFESCMPKGYLTYLDNDQDLKGVVLVQIAKPDFNQALKKVLVGTILA